MKLKKLMSRNYAATVRRGLITNDTTVDEFISKIYEEAEELYENPDDDSELADIILVCLAYAKHFHIDIVSALEQKVKYNEVRED